MCCKSTFSAIPISFKLASLHNRRAFFRRAKAIKPEAGANASAKRVRRAIKGNVWGGMQKNNGMWMAVVFSKSFPSRLSALLTHFALAFALLQKREKK